MSNKELQLIMRLRDEVTKRLTVIEGRMSKFTKSVSMGFVNLAAKVFLVRQAIELLGKGMDFIEAGARVQQQREAFENLAISVGFSTDKIISEMKRYSAETLSTSQIIEKANQAIILGIDPERLGKLMEIARASARAMGKDVNFMFDSITMGIGRQSKMILDNLGIIVKAEDAYKSYARVLGKTVNQLTEQEKRQAFLNATIEAGEDIIQKVNVQGKTQLENIQTLKGVWKNFTEQLSEFLNRAPIVAKALEKMGQAAEFLTNKLREYDGISLQSKLRELDEINKKIEFQQNLLGKNLFGGFLGIGVERGKQEQFINDLLKQRSKLILEINDIQRAGMEVQNEQLVAQQFSVELEKQLAEQKAEQHRVEIQDFLTREQERLNQLTVMKDAWRDDETRKELIKNQQQSEQFQFFIDVQKKSHQSLWAIAGQARDTFASGFSAAVTGVIEGTTKFKDAMIDLGKSMLKVLIDFIVQKGINFALSKAFLAAEVAASSAAAAVIASAWAPAAAMVSLATLGANGPPAAAAVASVNLLSQSLAALPGLAKGGDILGAGRVMVGERGPEILDLPSGARVTPLTSRTQNSGFSIGTLNIFVPTQRSDMSPEEIGLLIGDQIEKRIREGRSFI